MSPTELLTVRRQYAATLQELKPMCCTTSTIALGHPKGLKQDPWCSIPLELLKNWMAAWYTYPEIRPVVRRVWPQIWTMQ